MSKQAIKKVQFTPALVVNSKNRKIANRTKKKNKKNCKGNSYNTKEEIHHTELQRKEVGGGWAKMAHKHFRLFFCVCSFVLNVAVKSVARQKKSK